MSKVAFDLHVWVEPSSLGPAWPTTPSVLVPLDATVPCYSRAEQVVGALALPPEASWDCLVGCTCDDGPRHGVHSGMSMPASGIHSHANSHAQSLYWDVCIDLWTIALLTVHVDVIKRRDVAPCWAGPPCRQCRQCRQGKLVFPRFMVDCSRKKATAYHQA